MTALLLIGVTFGMLLGLWTLLAFTFNLIDQWHARTRAEDPSANMERETSEL